MTAARNPQDTCTRCGVLDEEGLTAELRQLRARLAAVEAERDGDLNELITLRSVTADLAAALQATQDDRENLENLVAGLRAERDAARAVRAYREKELLDLKGPCSTCRLHYAHSGPCDIQGPRP